MERPPWIQWLTCQRSLIVIAGPYIHLAPQHNNYNSLVLHSCAIDTSRVTWRSPSPDAFTWLSIQRTSQPGGGPPLQRVSTREMGTCHLSQRASEARERKADVGPLLLLLFPVLLSHMFLLQGLQAGLFSESLALPFWFILTFYKLDYCIRFLFLYMPCNFDLGSLWFWLYVKPREIDVLKRPLLQSTGRVIQSELPEG